jgi:ubiquinone/menaquinone biosynthesis C-methylase UbiE
LLPASKEPFAAALMEWEWTGSIYESRLWRRNPLITSIVTGISFEDEYKLILRAAKVTGDETLLDLACGPGIYTRPFAKTLDKGMVVGLDLSFSMLNYAVKRTRAEKIDNILFIHGDALNLPFADNQFDVINCCGALHLFPYPQVLRKIGCILTPGGRFTVGTIQHGKGGFLTRIREDTWRKSGVHPFSRDELTSLFTDAGLTDVVWHHSKRYYQIVSAMKP